ncbi:MAG: phytanoyl-CoA dioxygenase family protein [Leptothrix sp. (in: b-proteobacteria)]
MNPSDTTFPAHSPDACCASPAWLAPTDGAVEALAALLDAGRHTPHPPHAAEVTHGVPVYDCDALGATLASPAARQQLMAEWNDVLADGAGVLVLAGAWSDRALLDAVTTQFHALIEAERLTGGGGDHFAKPGANDRVWNALQKLCLRAPAAFARYYSNPWLAAVSTAWLGPAYQVTSQLNCVNPGGEAQQPHRDYHLGFCSAEQAAAYPAAVHRLSPRLTLQGAVAHVDMPIESGPTLLLPHSQAFEPGYLVAGRPDFAALFAQRQVQLPLRAGDAVFFNPALMHAAGHNRSSHIRRLGNLLQVSSAFGRAMESVDRIAMSVALYPALQAEVAAGRLSVAQAHDAIAACAEGYAFPTNLDRDPPIGGLAPASHQALMRQALAEGWPSERFNTALHHRAEQQRA